MEAAGYLESMDSVDGARWGLALGLHRRLRNGERGLGNQDIRQLIHFDRNQVFNLMAELRDEQSGLRLVGRGRYARYEYDTGTGQH